MKRILIFLLLLAGLNCHATDTFLRYTDGYLVVVDGVIQVGAGVTDDSILHYDFATNASVATYTIDVSANNNTGTVDGATFVWTNAVFGVYDFDGINDVLTAPYISAYSAITNEFTATVWVYDDNVADDDHVFNQYDTGANARTWTIRQVGDWEFGVGRDGGTTLDYLESGISPELNEWHYLGVTMDNANSNAIFYYDGLPVKTQTMAYAMGDFAGMVAIGGVPLGLYFHGAVALPKLWSRVRTPAEILSDYQAVTNNPAW